MSLTTIQMARMSKLLDEALPLDEPGRRRWLEELPPADRDLALVLRKSEVPDLKLEYSVPLAVNGPVALGAPLGQVIVHDGGIVMTQVAAISPVAVGTTQILNNVPLPPVENSGRSTIMNDATQENK